MRKYEEILLCEDADENPSPHNPHPRPLNPCELRFPESIFFMLENCDVVGESLSPAVH
jgi:hypothetical protein